MELLEGFFHLFSQRKLASIAIDAVDVLFVAYVIYRALLVVRGTRAMQMGTGLLVIFALYVGAKWAGLVTLFSMLSSLLSSIILVVVVVFQNDIRRGLVRVGTKAFLGNISRGREVKVIDEVVAAANELARHRMGALICFEQDANLDEFVVGQGTLIDAVVQRDLLVSLFVPESVNKLHDGAVIIRNFRVAKAGVFFPMPDAKVQDRTLGSRHRAALGITEETDAVVIIVSEERGTISFCFNGNIVSGLDGASLKEALIGLSTNFSDPPPRRVDRRAPAKAAKSPPSPAARESREGRESPASVPPTPRLTTPRTTTGATPALPLSQGLASFRSSIPPPPPQPEESMPMLEPAEPKSRPLTQSTEHTGRVLVRPGDSDADIKEDA